jgi:hypothetical protein
MLVRRFDAVMQAVCLFDPGSSQRQALEDLHLFRSSSVNLPLITQLCLLQSLLQRSLVTDRFILTLDCARQ